MPPIIDIAIWGTLGWLVGLLAYLCLAFLAPSLPGWAQDRIMDHYFKLCFASLGRGLIVARENAGLDLVRSTYDVDYTSERCTLDGATGWFPDHLKVMGRCYNKPLALVSNEMGMTVHPFLAEVGASVDELATAGKRSRVVTITDDDGNAIDTQLQMCKTVPVTDRPTAVDLLDAGYIDVEDTDPQTPEVAEEWARISQERHTEQMDPEQMMVAMTGFLVGGGARLVLSYVSGASGGENVVPIMIDVMGVLL